MEKLEQTFNQLVDELVSILKSDEHISITLNCERSQFSRFNHGKVRQSGLVNDGTVTIALINNSREAYSSFPFTGEPTTDRSVALANLEYLRSQVIQIPPNPYIVLPEGTESSREVYEGELLTPERSLAAVLEPIGDLDFTGLYASGLIMRGLANDLGQKHWFATDAFAIDYSIFTAQEKAVKGIYAGKNWQQSAYTAQIQQSKQQLAALDLPTKTIPRGQYRTYFAPSAAADLIGMLQGAAGEASLQQGTSALLKLRQGETKLSPLFTFKENFRRGSVPRFNELGVMAPAELPVIVAGELVNPLVSARTAKEYGKTANGASSGEYLRSPEVEQGTISSSEILAKLGTGLYLSNLHYLNWSDRASGRVTGMTRYACFWVESGEIVATIANLRFDDSIYDFLNQNLEGFTSFQEFIPNTDTYNSRSLGGILSPGMLVRDFRFTL